MRKSKLNIFHKIFFRFSIFTISLSHYHAVVAQDVPIPKYQLRYWCDPYEYPIESVQITKPSKLIKKTLLNRYVLPFQDEQDNEVIFSEQWGYDSIRCIPKSFRIHPFYIQKSEVSNLEYRTFLADSASAFFKENKITAKWAHPDTNVWLSDDSYTLPFVSYYFQHPAYNEYPVVGVSQFQATQYCNWLEIKLNNEYQNHIPQGYKIQVDLPTQGEFVKSVEYLVNKTAKTGNSTNTDFVKNWVEKHLYQLNIGPIQTLRLTNLFERKTGVFFNQNTKCSGMELCHLIGNVAEWTSTKAKGKIYNNLEYVYTMSNRLIPNADITATESELASYLHKSEDMNTHFLVKGGSWHDEFFYADPSSIQCRRGDNKTSYIGFRTVIRIVKQ